MAGKLCGISSMATRRMLSRLVAMWRQRVGEDVEIRAMGGVNAFRIVADGTESLDLVFLASDAIDELAASGRIVSGSKVNIAVSQVAMAVKKDAHAPDISSEFHVREAVLAAGSIGYSTGPSGRALLGLLDRWNIREHLRGRLVQAPPGVPVGSLVADGKAELGFQQLSELIHVGGIDVVGALPLDIRITTAFSGAMVSGCRSADDAKEFLAFTLTEDAIAAKQAEGLEPAPA